MDSCFHFAFWIIFGLFTNLFILSGFFHYLLSSADVWLILILSISIHLLPPYISVLFSFYVPCALSSSRIMSSSHFFALSALFIPLLSSLPLSLAHTSTSPSCGPCSFPWALFIVCWCLSFSACWLWSSA